ncbi:DUF4156 domain-containing protein [Octadecabacter sp. 1_MG-2023]|uniref:DUF4156 domain-containing protein n=1 Tax=unclassified Octadecabacter TaxID=196158 RepID=UPI001C0904AE|nr:MULTISPECIES: DUF4156 domain-containing protein [unclassified Octadecabacter]MBU2991602.1 DUF4156 domain-containing protein [Octadecabacter sp. B2R22]MDO6736129.1 DUF4156 domain-containing protein [Octadecabacter sp. 1_MG-2023]
MNRLILLLACSGLAACSAELTPEAQLVRQITPQMTERCQFLGPVSGTELMGMTVTDDVSSALNKLRNETAARGGNAFVLSNTQSSLDGSIALGDAYVCPT